MYACCDSLNLNAAGGRFGQYKMMQISMLVFIRQRELSNEYQHDRVKMVFEKSLHPCSLVKSSISIRIVKAQSRGTCDGR